MQSYGVKIKYTAYYHPQANPCETINRVLKTMLSSFVAENHPLWDVHLPKVGFVISASKYEVISFLPNYIVFGRELQLHCHEPLADALIQFNRSVIVEERVKSLSKMYEDVASQLFKAYNCSKVNYDLHRRDTIFT